MRKILDSNIKIKEDITKGIDKNTHFKKEIFENEQFANFIYSLLEVNIKKIIYLN